MHYFHMSKHFTMKSKFNYLLTFLFLIIYGHSFGQKSKHPIKYQLFGERVSVGIGIHALGDSSIHILHHTSTSRYSSKVEEKALPIHQLQYFKVRKKRNFLKGAVIGMGIGFSVGYLLGLTSDNVSCSGSGSGYTYCPSGSKADGLIAGGTLGVTGFFIGGFAAKSYVTINTIGKQEIYDANKGKLMPYIMER